MRPVKVLLITRNFPPLIGGMEKLIYHVYLGLRDRYQLALVSPSGASGFTKRREQTIEIHHSPASLFLLECQFQAVKTALHVKPDLIISGSGLTAPAAVCAGKIINKPVITFVHGLDIIAKHVIYQKVFIPAIRRCDIVIANSNNTAELVKKVGVKQNKIKIVYPGVNVNNAAPVASDRIVFQGVNLQTRPVLLSLGRLTERKGLLPFIDKALPDIIKNVPDALFIVIGEDAAHAINGKNNIRCKIERLIAAKKLQDNIILADYQDDSTIVDIYSATGVFVFPAIDLPDDIEGFGMVALEAAAHGVPTVAFACGGIPDAVNDNCSGFLVNPGDYDYFSRVTSDILLKKQTLVTKASCRNFAAQYNWDNFQKKINAVIDAV